MASDCPGFLCFLSQEPVFPVSQKPSADMRSAGRENVPPDDARPAGRRRSVQGKGADGPFRLIRIPERSDVPEPLRDAMGQSFSGAEETRKPAACAASFWQLRGESRTNSFYSRRRIE